MEATTENSAPAKEEDMDEADDLETWRQVHETLRQAVKVAQEAVAKQSLQRRFWLEELASNLTPEGKQVYYSVWKKPTTIRKQAKRKKPTEPKQKKPKKKRKQQSQQAQTAGQETEPRASPNTTDYSDHGGYEEPPPAQVVMHQPPPPPPPPPHTAAYEYPTHPHLAFWRTGAAAYPPHHPYPAYPPPPHAYPPQQPPYHPTNNNEDTDDSDQDRF